MTPETELTSSPVTRTTAEEPPSTLIIYIAVLFAAWLLYLLASPTSGSNAAPAWARFANQVPGFAIALLLAEGLYRRSRFAWFIGLLLGAMSIALGFLNQTVTENWAGIYTGGQAIIGAIEIGLLLLPPTQRWVRGRPAPADGRPPPATPGAPS